MPATLWHPRRRHPEMRAILLVLAAFEPADAWTPARAPAQALRRLPYVAMRQPVPAAETATKRRADEALGPNFFEITR